MYMYIYQIVLSYGSAVKVSYCYFIIVCSSPQKAIQTTTLISKRSSINEGKLLVNAFIHSSFIIGSYSEIKYLTVLKVKE